MIETQGLAILFAWLIFAAVLAPVIVVIARRSPRKRGPRHERQK